MCALTIAQSLHVPTSTDAYHLESWGGRHSRPGLGDAERGGHHDQAHVCLSYTRDFHPFEFSRLWLLTVAPSPTCAALFAHCSTCRQIVVVRTIREVYRLTPLRSDIDLSTQYPRRTELNDTFSL